MEHILKPCITIQTSIVREHNDRYVNDTNDEGNDDADVEGYDDDVDVDDWLLDDEGILEGEGDDVVLDDEGIPEAEGQSEEDIGDGVHDDDDSAF
ncbi:hypothetical protein DH2020_005537 [Rehmannia glutinosa]|uniref:Uncharacterized protein n=1 Tax=Rehmannia glutinosa TaxID=99300 RepID=A0ABR0XG99_REHGL